MKGSQQFHPKAQFLTITPRFQTPLTSTWVSVLIDIHFHSCEALMAVSRLLSIDSVQWLTALSRLPWQADIMSYSTLAVLLQQPKWNLGTLLVHVHSAGEAMSAHDLATVQVSRPAQGFKEHQLPGNSDCHREEDWIQAAWWPGKNVQVGSHPK